MVQPLFLGVILHLVEEVLCHGRKGTIRADAEDNVASLKILCSRRGSGQLQLALHSFRQRTEAPTPKRVAGSTV